MQNIKEFFLLLFVLLRFALKLLGVQFLRLIPVVAEIRSWAISRYYRWKFPQIMQMRKLVGAEAQEVYGQIMEIRLKARDAIKEHHAGELSKSQLKKLKALVHNEEKAYMEANDLRFVQGVIYKLDGKIRG